MPRLGRLRANATSTEQRYYPGRFGLFAGVGQHLRPKRLMSEPQQFYHDAAHAFNPYTLPSFKNMVPPSHILCGTDYPLGGGSAAIVAKGLMANGAFTASEMRSIDRENALGLLPRLRT